MIMISLIMNKLLLSEYNTLNKGRTFSYSDRV